jgi:hypothetical protein
VEGIFRISRCPPRRKTQSVNVLPASNAMRMKAGIVSQVESCKSGGGAVFENPDHQELAVETLRSLRGMLWRQILHVEGRESIRWENLRSMSEIPGKIIVACPHGFGKSQEAASEPVRDMARIQIVPY